MWSLLPTTPPWAIVTDLIHFVDDKTLVFVFVNNDAYTRQYDIDILNEIGGDKSPQHTIAVQQEGATVYEG